MNWFHAIPPRQNSGSLKNNMMQEDNPHLPKDIVPFSAADMEFKNAPEIIQAIKDFLDSENGVLAYYGQHPGYAEAVADWMLRRHNWKIDPKWIVPGNGILPSLYVAVDAFTNPQDNVIIITPVYDPFFSIVAGCGRNILTSDLIWNGERYVMNYEEIEKLAHNSNTTTLMLCSPHNPVGRVWSKEELERLARICIENDVLILNDEAHHDLILPGFHHTCLASISDEIAEHCITFTAPSKGFNLAGMQQSNTIIKNETMRNHYYKDVCLTKEYYTCNPLSYRACEAAYKTDGTWIDELNNVIDKNRQFATNYLKENIPEIHPMPMEGTYLLWLDCRALGLDRHELEKLNKEKAYLYLDEGYMFGEAGAGFVRWNLACHISVLEKGLERWKKAIDEWRKANEKKDSCTD
ncbi:hemolysin [Claveliimonas bilis]|uniref:MalY/PatB family protein n=1 Tax=Claveliimonas bilis TaxID=3028070 RepID=UPI00292D6780|nr:PatB family C-S lyase [Claveliimonas bilis]BDZ83429.1 hemolysin [Claveliimonas bilis]